MYISLHNIQQMVVLHVPLQIYGMCIYDIKVIDKSQ
jgi:hypothetical protein